MNAEIDISNITIKTERLLLRPWKETDLEDFFEYASVEGVGEMAGWPHHKNKDETKSILDSFINHRKTFAIEYKEKVIGSVGIEEYKEKELPELDNKAGRELGFVLSKDYWGKGFMPEAIKGVIDYLFNQIQLDFIVCCHSADNIQSKKVQEKCGFKLYKKGKRETACGTVVDDCVNILIK